MKRFVFALLLLSSVAFADEFQEFSYKANNGGLNTKASPLFLKDNESPDCLNVYFDTDGAIIKRNGSVQITTEHITMPSHYTSVLPEEHTVSGLAYYMKKDGTDYLVEVIGGAVYKTDDIEGTPEHITGDHYVYSAALGTTELQDFEVYLDTLIATDGEDEPWTWDGAGSIERMGGSDGLTLPYGLTKAKYVALFKDRLFLANVTISGVTYPSRVYFSAIGSITDWTATDFINITTNDGQAITGLEVLGDRLVVFKTNSIYNILFTGSSDIPFYVQKSDSDVGCIAGHSIQDVKNNLIFLSSDGIYAYDGLASIKISDRISPTLRDYNAGRYDNAVSANYKLKNQYWLTFTDGSGTESNEVIVWDYYHNAFTRYNDLNLASMVIVFTSNGDRLYTGGYEADLDRQDYGTSDSGTSQTNGSAIDAYYWTKWFDWGSLGYKKRPMYLYLFAEASGNWYLTTSYVYDLEGGVYKSAAMNLSGSGAVVGTAIVGTSTIGISGTIIKRFDLIGQGGFARFKFANINANEPFRIEGFSILAKPQGIMR
jgi:hypothetical protein